MGEEREKIIVDLVRSRQPEELSIKEIAEELGIWQQEASAAVGRLVKEGVLKQRGRSPVRVSLGEGEQKTVKSQPPFSGIIGSQGSHATAFPCRFRWPGRPYAIRPTAFIC